MNSKSPSIKLNMVMNALLTLSSIIFPVITIPYVTRVLGAEGVGKVYFASSVIAGFAIFAELGIPVYGIRACARVRDSRTELSKTASEILTINLVTCLIVYLCFALSLRIIPRFAEDKLLLIIMSSTMILNCVGMEWLYKAIEKYSYITIRSVSFKLIALIAMFLLVRESSDTIAFGFITIFALSASNLLNLLNLHKHVDIRPVNPSIEKHLPGMLMLFALAAATTVYTNLDLVILDFLKGDAEAGLYGVSVKIKLVIVSLVTSVSAVLLPRNSFYYEKELKDNFYKLLSETIRIVIMAAVPAAIYFMIFAKESIEVLGGNSFAGAVLPMTIIMPSVVLIGISNVIGIQMLVPAGKEKVVVSAAIIGAIADLVLNFALIPSMGSSGAAIATLAAEMCVTGYMLANVRSEAGELFADTPAIRIIIAAALAGIVSIAARKLSGIPIVVLMISAILYFCTYTLILILTKKK